MEIFHTMFHIGHRIYQIFLKIILLNNLVNTKGQKMVNLWLKFFMLFLFEMAFKMSKLSSFKSDCFWKIHNVWVFWVRKSILIL